MRVVWSQLPKVARSVGLRKIGWRIQVICDHVTLSPSFQEVPGVRGSSSKGVGAFSAESFCQPKGYNGPTVMYFSLRFAYVQIIRVYLAFGSLLCRKEQSAARCTQLVAEPRQMQRGHSVERGKWLRRSAEPFSRACDSGSVI